MARGRVAAVRAAAAAPAGRTAAVVALGTLAAVNVAAQATISERLAQTRGKGFLSDAIHRFADDLNAMPEKPYVWFSEPALALPLSMLTRATVPMSDRIDDPEPRRRMCEERDVPMLRPERHFSAPRAREWQARRAWDEPLRRAYAQADGVAASGVATFRGRRDGPGCTASPSAR